MAAFELLLPLIVAGLSFAAGFVAGVLKAARMQARREMREGYFPSYPTPHSLEVMETVWLSFPEETKRAYGSFARYYRHLMADPLRALDNPIPQPWPMHAK